MGEQLRIQILRYLEARRGGVFGGAMADAMAQRLDVPLNLVQDELEILVAKRLVEARHDYALQASVYLILPEGRLRIEDVVVPATEAPKRAIFISWSGPESHAVALAIRGLLLATLGQVDTFLSSDDLAKGSRWNQKLGSVLDSTCYGILCVVAGNAREPWLNFEAGALSKSTQRSEEEPCVAPFLVDVKPQDLPASIGQFNATRFDSEDVLKLLDTLNQVAGVNRSDKQLHQAFELAWPGFREKVEKRPRTRSSSRSDEDDDDDSQRLPEEAVKVLQIMAVARHYGNSTTAIAGELELSELRVRALIGLLRRAGFVWDGMDGAFVTEQGVQYLYAKGLC